jgi:hypothetical protein
MKPFAKLVGFLLVYSVCSVYSAFDDEYSLFALRICLSKANTKDRDWNHRSEQQRLFALLCNQIDSDSECSQFSGSSNTRRSALQKRLQRARKFLLVVDAFGLSILDSVPEVSVSRVDVLRMEELRSLVDGSCMKTEVESIRRKQDSLKGMVSTLLGGIHFYVCIALVADGVAFFRLITSLLASNAETAMKVQVVKAQHHAIALVQCTVTRFHLFVSLSTTVCVSL